MKAAPPKPLRDNTAPFGLVMARAISDMNMRVIRHRITRRQVIGYRFTTRARRERARSLHRLNRAARGYGIRPSKGTE